jgi:cell division protein FtsW
MFLVSMASPAQIRRLGTIGFAFAFLAVALLPVFGTDFGKGAVRWYSLGFASLQPSEFLKPCFVIIVAWLMASAQEPSGPPGRALSLLLLMPVLAFLLIQPDFGQAALVLFSWCVMYFVAGAPILVMLAVGGVTILGGVLAYNSSEHFARRIDGFLAAEVDPRTQIGYATDAIREGGFFGVGVGEGQVRWTLPDAHTDFIIAVAAEEYGLVMVLAIMGLFALILLRSLALLLQERDAFVRLAATGLVCTFTVQAMINMGVAVRLLPAKGMTLPFVSYGGSSLIAGGLTIGMLLALTRSRPQGVIGDILARGRLA